jgi:hypothetical protein
MLSATAFIPLFFLFLSFCIFFNELYHFFIDMVPLGLDIKGCAFFIFVREVDDNNSHIFNKIVLVIKIYWEIGATAPFFRPQIRKTTTVGHLPEGNGICGLILGSRFSKPHFITYL